MKKLIAVLLLCAAMQANALELAGVKPDDGARVGNATLQLNGAGLRTRFFFKVYVGALYLTQKQHNAGAVLTDAEAKRVTLHMLRDVSGKSLIEAFDKGLEANNTPAQLFALDARINDFSAIFRATDGVKEGDVIAIDYLPGEGTRVSINGAEKGRVAGAEFYRALLKVWIGDAPVDADLKKGMLGD